MPRRRRFRRTKRRRYSRRGRVTKRYVRSAINREIETKVDFGTMTIGGIDSNASGTQRDWMTGITPLGTNSQQRIGSKIKLRSLQLKGYCGITTGRIDAKIRLVIVQMTGEFDASTSSSMVTFANILNGYSAGISDVTHNMYMYPYFNLPGIKILWDKTWVLNEPYVKQKIWRKRISGKRMNRIIQWFATGSTEYAKNHIGFYVISDKTNTTDAVFGMDWRLTYKDA